MTPAELAVLLVALFILAAAAVPMCYRYSAAAARSAVRGDLKTLQASMEAYYTAHQDVPVRPEGAVPGWAAGYSGRYSYTRYGFHHYEFSTREKIGGKYLFIDQRGTVEERE